GMVHSEQLIDPGGAITLERLGGSRYKVTNQTKLSLKGVGIVGNYSMAAWLGTLEPRESKEIELDEAPGGELWAKELNDSPVTAADTTGTDINLRRLIELAYSGSDDQRTKNGLRLVAWTDEELPGMTISPAASQARSATLVLVNLQYGPEKALQHDTTTRAMAMKEEQPPPFNPNNPP